VQDLKALWKWWQRLAGGDDLRDYFQTAQQVGGAIRLGKAGVAIGGCQHDLRYVASGIKYPEPAKRKQLGCNLGAQTTVSEAEVEDGEIRLVKLSQRDRLGHSAGDAANFVSLVGEDLFRQIRDHQIIFGNQHLEHAHSSGMATMSPAVVPKIEAQTGLGSVLFPGAAVEGHLRLGRRHVGRPVKKSLCNFDHIKKIAARTSQMRSDDLY
jgi:hypothetical protein